MKKYIFIFLTLMMILMISYFSQDRTTLHIISKENTKTHTLYQFSKDNYLEKIISPSKLIIYNINNKGLKSQKSIDDKIIERYFWLGEGQLSVVTDQNNHVLRQYIYQNKHEALPMGMITNGHTFKFIYNTQRSLRVVLDEQDNVVKVVDYNENGSMIKDTNPLIKVDFSYIGGLWDNDAQLLFYTQGVYDPIAKRWITKVNNIDILENIKQLEKVNDNTVYKCNATLDVYYHSYLCAKQQCGGLYATDYLNYFNGKGALIDNSIYFNHQYCKPIVLPKQYDQALFALCVHQKIQPNENLLFDAWQHNCHHEVNNIINQCKVTAFIKETHDK